jgi:hypothetical protein
MAVAVWGSLDQSPGYAVISALLHRLLGDQAVDALRAPCVLGDTQVLASLFVAAGIPDAQITTHEGTARFPSVHSWIRIDIKDWTLGDMIDESQYERLLQEAERVLQPFVAADGTVVFRVPAHIVTATKPKRG